MRMPSVKTLVNSFRLTNSQARDLRTIMSSTNAEEVMELSTRARDHDRQCYNSPSLATLKMEAMNQIIEGYGVEVIDAKDTKSRQCVSYVNMGDAYVATICRTNANKYRVCCWVDLVTSERFYNVN